MITILTIVRSNYTEHVSGSQSKTEIMQHATVLGINAAFAFTAILMIIGFVLTLMIRTKKKQSIAVKFNIKSPHISNVRGFI